ncbi:conserved hypothetical protein [Bosea sp. 62]|uniref:type VI secretion system baseplate subunit TssF n=1 Tax=unclassified Bosea (in: a-proteobacteria) TaxID=2653178 RepID=UPI0012579C71|nr:MULTISPECIES: type VI secretion system baseplate subunit TssF [unclassified Bosea (in: a-proteobacteria)]CAD5293933.1 conserved hypothetical protein [Bosea sp. 21B]CAD5294529.1 conserved hypothetical protein [Bosea sp. 46]CAD5298982.1 conserved hypothetical protein [Bosea sp. 7B]VVT60822.1 Type VI secretion system protein ImpG [Bosea sp. EC-HK365B]VXB40110.1 conserved hypothetical protein [Bosea sp. 127]
MSLNAHYEDELSYLRELGQEFSRANPKLAGFLSREASDPDVERLLEGFAFTVARLRQKLEDEMPELVHGLIRLVWPHYLRPIPPMSVVAFEAAAGGGPGVTRVPAGIALASRPVDGVSCRFRTCYPVEVLPFSIMRTESENRPTTARLALTLQAAGRGTLQGLQGGRLRLFFNTEREPQVGRTLLLWLSRHLRSITVTSDSGESATLPASAIRPVGFEDGEGVLPYPSNAFIGFRHLQEYLAFPAKFLFVDVTGLEALAGLSGKAATFAFEFSRPFPDQVRVAEGHVRLNCTPVVNLFAHEAHPLRIDRSRSEYRVVAGGRAGAEIYAIDKVTGYLQGRAERIVYEPFEAFRHDLPGEAESKLFYRERLRPAVVGRGVDHYLSFVSRLERASAPPAEVISIGLTCSNGALAERLPVGAIDQPTSETPATVSFANVMGVTPHTPPPIGENLLWRLISNLSRNYGSLVDVGALRTLVASYDFRAVHDAQARRRLELLLEGLEAFESGVEDGVLRGQPVRVRTIRLTVAESKIGGEAELYLFGAVLERFFAVYASLNSLHRFAIHGTESKVEYKWTPRAGTTSAT